MANPLIVVVGSINMDLVVRVGALPVGGQTVTGSDLQLFGGGKGANQAVAAARLGAAVQMVGRVGADDFGNRLVAGLELYGVATTYVTVTDGAATGTASIWVNQESGENSIVVSPGANGRVTPGDVDRALPLIRGASAVLLQLEIPMETVLHTMALCHRYQVPVIVDPAPVPGGGVGGGVGGKAVVPSELFSATVFTPNQTEAAELMGWSGGVGAGRDAKEVAAELLRRGPVSVVLKLGDQGSLYASGDGTTLHVPAFKVKVKDTTAAGDAFTAALAVARAEGKAPAEALRFANAVGAITCMNAGAQSSLPGRAEVEEMLRRWG